jgi:phospholipase/carboxylesterase
MYKILKTREVDIKIMLPSDSLIIEPKKTATSCVIWMHGLGDSSEGFAPVVDALDLPENHSIRFILPNAPIRPITINNGASMRAWYDIKDFDFYNRVDYKGMEESERLIQALIKEQINVGIEPESIVLVGFSQGGVLALQTGLRFSHTLAGVLALSCYLPSGKSLPIDCHKNNQSTKIAIHHGNQDPIVPLELGKIAYDILKGSNYDVTWSVYKMPHSVVPEQIKDIRQWLLERLNTR